jgi:hypothetical protein
VEHLTDGALLDRVRGMHWPARRVVRGLYQGGHRSKRVGSSPEFMQYREYRPGDEAAKIDWKLFARTSRMAIRQTHDDSNLRTSILLDASASMAYPVPGHDKWKLAASIAFGLCAVTQSDRDPVGVAVVSGDGAQVLPPRARMSTTSNVLRILSKTAPGGSPELTPVLNSQAYRMSGGNTSIEEMIARTERGLLVTRLTNVRLVDSNSLLCTGTTSDGVWLIERGEITRPVKNFRFRESPLFAFNSLEALGEPVRVLQWMPTIVPPALVHDFSMTSLADAV